MMNERETEINFGTERNRQAYERLTPEQKDAVARIRARHRAPEFQQKMDRARAEIRAAYAPPDDRLVELLATLRTERERQGLSLADLSERTGMDKGQISKLENGKVLNPTFASVRALANALGLRLEWSTQPLEPTA